MKYRDKIIEYFDALDTGVVVSANALYESHFSTMSQSAFFKAMERLVIEGILIRISKGLYAKAGTEEAAEDAVLNYYFGENNDNGMYIGYHLYQKYGITNVSKEYIELYSNKIKKQTGNIGRIRVKHIGIALNYENTKVIEALEILQNYDNIEGLNKLKFARYARQFARGYQDEAAVYVIESMKYKKRTIAFMKKILDMYKVEHSLGQFISYATRYQLPTVQKVAK